MFACDEFKKSDSLFSGKPFSAEPTRLSIQWIDTGFDRERGDRDSSFL